MNKAPTVEDRIAALQQGYPGQSRDMQPADPLDAALLQIPIEEIREYEHNPRQVANARAEEIRQSILARGMDQPLVITRRPGEPHYIPKGGGNTRLRILRELFEQTGDRERYGTVQCKFEPWQDEADALIGHLVENEVRGDLMFIDRARAVMQVRKELENEAGRELSQRELAESIKERGYGVPQPVISLMEYAAGTLLPLIPEALRAGAGKPQIQRIRRLENAIRRSVVHHRSDETNVVEDALDGLYKHLAEHDAEDWTLESVIQDVVRALSRLLEIPHETVRRNIDALMENSKADLGGPAMGLTAEESETHLPAERRDSEPDPASDHPESRPPLDPANVAAESSEPAKSLSSAPAETAPAQMPDTEDGIDGDSADTASDLPFVDVSRLLQDPKSLRARMWTLATRLAGRLRLGDCVVPIGNRGCGFLMDLPPEPLGDFTGALIGEWDPEWFQYKRVALWWLLTDLSLVLQSNGLADDLIAERTPRLHELLAASSGLDRIALVVGQVESWQYGCTLWGHLSETEIKDLCQLLQTYGAIWDLAAAAAVPGQVPHPWKA
jgi:ParB family protein of integrating conjugative element (PFGI_1 class)